jgi:excisionase family DNA binding protein
MPQPVTLPTNSRLHTRENSGTLGSSIGPLWPPSTENVRVSDPGTDQIKSWVQPIEPSEDPRDWLTAAEAAQYLKVKKRTLLFWARIGKVPGYLLSGTHRHTWRFLKSELDDTIIRHSQCAAKEKSNAA